MLAQSQTNTMKHIVCNAVKSYLYNICVPFMIIIQFDYCLLACTRQHSIIQYHTPASHVLTCVQTNIKNKMRRIKTNAPTEYCVAI